MKIIDYLQNKKVSITPETILKVAIKLGIPATDLNYDLTDEDAKALDQSRTVYVATVNEKAIIAINSLIASREIIIEEYRKALLDPNLTSKDRTILEENLQEIIDTKHKLDNSLRIVNEKNNKGMLGYVRGLDIPITIDPIAQFRIENMDKKMERISGRHGKIEQEHIKLESLMSKEYSSEFAKRAGKSHEEAIRARIATLQTKEVIIQNKQREIINEKIPKYLNKHKWKAQNKVATRETSYVNKRSEYLDNIDKTKENIELTKLETARLRKGNFVEKIQSVGKIVDRTLLSTRLIKLRALKGFCQINNQVVRQVRKTIKDIFGANPQQINDNPTVSKIDVEMPNIKNVNHQIRINGELAILLGNREVVLSKLITFGTKKELGEEIREYELLQVINNSELNEDDKEWLKNNFLSIPGKPNLPLDKEGIEYLNKLKKEAYIIESFMSGKNLSVEEEEELSTILLSISGNKNLYEKYINDFNGLTIPEIDKLLEMSELTDLDKMALQTQRNLLVSGKTSNDELKNKL